MAMRTATGFEELAIFLEGHIKQYKPSGWICPIGNVAYTPMIDEADYRHFHDAYNDGSLAEDL